MANTSESAGIGSGSSLVDAEDHCELADPVINIKQSIMLRAKTPGAVVTAS